jgi:hypothetical protein
MQNNEYGEETRKALATVQNLTGAVIHSVNNLLAPFNLNMAKAEMYLESDRADQLKRELPEMIASMDVHLNAVMESLKILYDTVSADRARIEYWDGVDIRTEVKARVDKILKAGK